MKALGLFLFASVLAIFGTQMAFATNTPCSGHKGGISRCQGSTFICNDGSVSASKKNCAAYMSGSSDQPLGLIDGGSGEMSPAARESAAAGVDFSASARAAATTAQPIAGERAICGTSDAFGAKGSLRFLFTAPSPDRCLRALFDPAGTTSRNTLYIFRIYTLTHRHARP